MSSKIKDSVRKKLWALSAGKCAICDKNLIGSNGFIVGQECHIISSKPSGPRYVQDLNDYNDYDNLILLCANHHREIDTNIAIYPIDKLKQIKKEHEQKVEKRQKEQKREFVFLVKINTGETLGNVILGNDSWTIATEINNPYIEKISMELDDSIRIMLDLQGFLELQDKLEFYNKLDGYIKTITEQNLGIYINTSKKRINGLVVSSVLIVIKDAKSDFCFIKRDLLT